MKSNTFFFIFEGLSLAQIIPCFFFFEGEMPTLIYCLKNNSLANIYLLKVKLEALEKRVKYVQSYR